MLRPMMRSARDQRSVRGARASPMTAPIVLGAARLVLLACGSTTTNSPVEDGGHPMDSAGSIGGAGGMAGGGGASSTDASDAGTGGADRNDGSLQPFPCIALVPLGPEITDFSGTDPTGTWGDPSAFGGGVYSYGGSSDGGNDLTVAVDLAVHSLRVTGKVTSYSGFGLYFNQFPDASPYRGISFKPSGTLCGRAL